MENIQVIHLDQSGTIPKATMNKQLFFQGLYLPPHTQPFTQLAANPHEIEEEENESDYTLFLRRSNQNGRNYYPSAFSVINIVPHSQEEMENYEQLNFPILSFSKKQLATVSGKILAKYQGPLLQTQLNQIIKKISQKYNQVSYHNFSHGFSLMHLLHNCLKMDSEFSELFSKEEKFFALLAALAHDIAHPGTNNDFEIKRKSNLAIVGENTSVLQKMHTRTFFQILEQYKLFENMTNPLQIKEMMTKVILATDVSRHFNDLTILKQTKNLSQNKENRIFALEQVFHACDIGNPCINFQQYINWASLLTYQFHEQTIEEAKEGLKVTQFFKYQGLKPFYKGQIGFINNLVFPLWKELSVRWEGFNPLVENIQKNIQSLEKLVAEENQ